MAASLVVSVLLTGVSCVITHVVITKVGMIYVDREVLKDGNDQTLDNLEEGVIIIDEKEMKIRFYNKAASVAHKIFGSTAISHHEHEKPDYTSFAEEN